MNYFCDLDFLYECITQYVSSCAPNLFRSIHKLELYLDPYVGITNYVNSNNLHVVPPAMYNDNPSLFFPPGHAYDAQMGFGQYSPIPSPISPVVIDGQLFSPHQIHMSPSYYPQTVSPGLPHGLSGIPVSQTDESWKQ
ncbi:hypothetical protein LIER_20608 [Lithospermum erythrorhizon]|uniref:Uncharacterized protein n=1 Tax=Lithospermum erythrorhizon TaxID=34254 RepID=A0AAV3QN12_LITER